jgi:hypothetical protein
MSKKDEVVINNVFYLLEIWLAKTGDFYKFGIQAMPRKLSPVSYSLKISEEFLEDEIDNKKDPGYLESLVLIIAKNHLKDMMTLAPFTITRSITAWFKEAKQSLDKKLK